MIINYADAQLQESNFTIINKIACPDHTLILECTVQSTPDHKGESTVWRGTFFRNCDHGTSDDNVIVLLHSRFRATNSRTIICNNGSVIGQSLSVDPENVTYTSQLIIIVNPEMIGKSISCEYDNGSMVSTGSIKLIPNQTQIQDGE